MCGIIGVVGERPAAPILLDGLKRLEYRGYDSAGIATIVNGGIGLRRAEGKLGNLSALIEREPLDGMLGIGHTRWATHGRPSEANAHPHANEHVAVVHNGIVENYRELRGELEARGHAFATDTDTEAVVHLITEEITRQKTPGEAVAAALRRMQGAFALAIIFAGRHDLLIGARQRSSLVVGYGDGAMYLGSDALALAPLCDRICYLEDGDWVELSCEGAVIRDAIGQQASRPLRSVAVSGAMIGKGPYRHFMQKEIFEQPTVIGETLAPLIDPLQRRVQLPSLPIDLADIPRLTLSACGTAFYACLVAKYWLEGLARQPAQADLASEFRYREPCLPRDGLAVVVSQSGETVDTLEGLRFARQRAQHTLAIVNVVESAIARDADCVLQSLAGPEIGVASTKAFTAQLAVLACLTIAAGRARGSIGRLQEMELVQALSEVPGAVAAVLDGDQGIRAVAEKVARARDVLYLGRGALYPIALEGALKLKEISYIHAEGYAAGEMKHGPIALVDEHVPVICLAPSGPMFDKVASNVREALARDGLVVLLSDRRGIARLGDCARHAIEIPDVPAFVAPFVYAVAVQLLAYHAAAIKGTDVDQPRNLAKSVTVE